MPQSDKSLSKLRALESVAPDTITALERLVRWHEYLRDQQIIGHQDESSDVFFIVSGSVRVTVYSPAGKEVTFRDMAAGEMFGELAAIDGKPRSAGVVALSNCTIASLTAQQFGRVLHEHPDFAVVTLKRLAETVRSLSERVFEVSALSVRNRIHAELLRLARSNMLNENRAAISPAPTHSAIASRISTHREAVTRELSKLSKSGLIERQGNKIVVNDVHRLSRLVEDVLGI
ncbi:MAG: Crp/Fnr family transcriptional regulator [Kiloniellales bacterium]